MFGVTPQDTAADGKGWSGDVASVRSTTSNLPLFQQGRPDPLENLLESERKMKGGGFQTMGFSKEIMRAIHQMGYNVPTPVQRKAIPPMMQGSDMVAMARTGSGKTAAFALPMLHNLGEHSKMSGIRALILSPTRELALQILANVRNLGKFTNLTCTAIVGGKSLDAQFCELAANPDIVVATPGRILHVVEEAEMKLTSVRMILLDEADRLFEMGLQPQIVSIMQRINDGAQRALFSATMPSMLAEFSNAGLRNPVVVRLDAEMKLSDKLQQSSFVVRSDEKVAALLVILRHVIGVRRKTARDKVDQKLESEKERALAKGKRFVQHTLDRIDAHKRSLLKDEDKKKGGKFDKKKNSNSGAFDNDTHGQGKKKKKVNEDADSDEESSDDDEEYMPKGDIGADGVQALVFVESKHHVEFLADLMELYEIPCSAVHGQMDQEARRLAISAFEKRRTAVCFVTDVAARGIDLPLLDNVINFSFPQTPKLFVHRVGRVARAGRAGSAYSLMTMEDMPSYVDLMEFLDLEVKCSLPNQGGAEQDKGFQAMLSNPYDGFFGRLPEEKIQQEFSFLRKAIADDPELSANFITVMRAHKKFLKTKRNATPAAMRQAKKYTYETVPLHPVLLAKQSKKEAAADAARIALRAFKAKETYLDIVHGARVFEVKKPQKAQLTILREEEDDDAPDASKVVPLVENVHNKVTGTWEKTVIAAPVDAAPKPKLTLAEQMTLKAAMSRAKRNRDEATDLQQGTGSGSYSVAQAIFAGAENGEDNKDEEFFMADRPEVRKANSQYSINDATLDINADCAEDATKARTVFAWNKRKNRYQKMHVNDAKAMVRGIKNEAGKKIDFKKGKLDAYNKWMKTSNMRIQDIGEEEDTAAVELAKAAAKSGKYKADDEDEDGGDIDHEEQNAISRQLKDDPNMGKKLKIGRKLKRLPNEGKVRNFTEMKNKKDKKAKQDGKLANRRAKKAEKRGVQGAGKVGGKGGSGPPSTRATGKKGWAGPKMNRNVRK